METNWKYLIKNINKKRDKPQIPFPPIQYAFHNVYY